MITSAALLWVVGCCVSVLCVCVWCGFGARRYECLYGNGPVSSVQGKAKRGSIGLWDKDKDVLEGIQWLAANAER
eukprot:COSAG06_NODE_40286_length_403_cov_0.993421_1_plen_75_part_00